MWAYNSLCLMGGNGRAFSAHLNSVHFLCQQHDYFTRENKTFVTTSRGVNVMFWLIQKSQITISKWEQYLPHQFDQIIIFRMSLPFKGSSKNVCYYYYFKLYIITSSHTYCIQSEVLKLIYIKMFEEIERVIL